MARLGTPSRSAIGTERAIARAGGIDVQILGVGTNGHIGFNEPAPALQAWTHRVTLEPDTRRDNAGLFGGDPAAVPAEALSMGIATILQARRVDCADSNGRREGVDCRAAAPRPGDDGSARVVPAGSLRRGVPARRGGGGRPQEVLIGVRGLGSASSPIATRTESSLSSTAEAPAAGSGSFSASRSQP